jgi:hypothetical protein
MGSTCFFYEINRRFTQICTDVFYLTGINGIEFHYPVYPLYPCLKKFLGGPPLADKSFFPASSGTEQANKIQFSPLIIDY